MAITSAQIAALTDYSFSEIKVAAKQAMVAALLGGASMSIGGRTIMRVNLKEAKAIFEWAGEMDALQTGGDTVLVRRAERI